MVIMLPICTSGGRMARGSLKDTPWSAEVTWAKGPIESETVVPLGSVPPPTEVVLLNRLMPIGALELQCYSYF